MSEPMVEHIREVATPGDAGGAVDSPSPYAGSAGMRALPGLARPRAGAIAVRRDLADDWKQDSKASGPRSKLLKVVDTAVKTFQKDAAKAAEPATLTADLKAILQALDDWGKIDTSQRSVAAKALQSAVQSELGKLSTKAKPTPPARSRADARADLTSVPTASESKSDTTPSITPEAVTTIVEGAATVLSSVTDEVPGLSAVKEAITGPSPTTGSAPKTEAKTEAKTEIKTEIKTEAKTELKTELKTEPKIAPKTEDKKDAAKPAETPLEKATRLEAEVLKGKTEADLSMKRADLLDALMPLPDARFAAVAAELVLSTNSVVDGKETRAMAAHILTVQLHNKAVARKLLDEQVKVVVIPRDKKMTDLVEFESLKDAKTFDGRTWNEVRGSGGFRVPGKSEVYVAVAEENVTGKDATGDAAGTSWCYAKGYSTTSHEFAHVMDNYGLEAADRKTVDDLYAAKHTLDSTTAQEWIDGWNVEVGPTTAAAAKTAWKTLLVGDTDAAKLEAAFAKLAAGGTVASAGISQADLIKHKLLSADGSQLLGADGKAVGSISGAVAHFDGGSPKTKTECYASVHRLEYFAQTANAYLGTNAGNDPYTIGKWTTLGQPDKGKRRNGKAEVKRIEPELHKVMEKLFAKGTLAGANPRKGA